jgi:hypothetical protein
MIGLVIALTVVAVLGVAGGIGWSNVSKERREARNLPLCRDGSLFKVARASAWHLDREADPRWRSAPRRRSRPDCAPAR